MSKVGMYGGKFLPFPHMGHVYAMTVASTMVDELHVIVSYDTEYEKKLCKKGGKVDHVDYKLRVRWWKQLTKDMPHVKVHAVHEKQTGQFSDWERGAEGIKNAIGKPIDVVFSSELSYTPIFEELYPGANHIVIDSERSAYNISGTRIREEGVMKHWDMIPRVVQPYFAKKVVVVGTESCGKSTLVKNLAALYNTSYVSEYGRTFYEKFGSCEDVTIANDYPEIAFEHKYHEKVELQRANKVLFIDTEAVVTQYYSKLYLNSREHLPIQPILDEIIRMQQYDLWLFLEPDVKWVDDGTRTFGEQVIREKNNKFLKSLLREHDIEYVTISGDYSQRLEKAFYHVNKLINS